jgi:hypothetical protein
MRRRYIFGAALTLVLAAVMAFGAIGSGAWFTDTVTLTGNKVEAGTMTMELSGILASPANMAPGDHYELGTLTLRNTGSLPYKLRFKMETTEGEELADQLDVTLSSSLLGTFKPKIRLGSFTGRWIGYTPSYPFNLCQQDPDDEDTVAFELDFVPLSNNDDVQGVTWKGTLFIEATQSENPGWTE